MPPRAFMAYIRIVIWLGVILDSLSVIQYCLPETTMDALGITVTVTPVLRFVLIQTAALMTAWTLLLVWVDRAPLERQVVLLLTAQIAFGIALSFTYLIAEGTLTGLGQVYLVAPLITAGLFSSAYIIARFLSRTETAIRESEP